jgi:predicted dehydrogenase
VELSAAIVGCGPRGVAHGLALAQVEGISLSGVCDLARPARERAAAELGVSAYDEVSELLAAVAPDVAIVATQPRGRAELIAAIVATESVRAVVVEKPLALSMSEAAEIVAAADRAQVRLSVCHQLRFTPHFRALQESVERGDLGTIEFIRGLAYGHLLDQGDHLVDGARALTGGRRFTWAMSQGGAALASGSVDDPSQLDVPDWTTSNLALDGGVRCTIETGPLHQRSERFGQGEDEIDDYLDKRFTVVGSRGVAQFVTGGECRILTEDDADWRVHPGGIHGAVSGTRLFHEAVRDSLLNDTEPPAGGHDALHSLEGLLAAARSATTGEAVRLPLRRDEDAAPEVRRSPEPEVSVILPIADHRGYAERGVSSWTQGQSFDRDRYEVVLAWDGAEAGLGERVEPLLGDGDRLIRNDEATEIELYDQAARAARGRLLIFTEPHCIAEPEFIEELLTYLAQSGEVGACGRTVAISPNAFARMEQRLYDEGFSVWSQPGQWCRVILRAFAIERAAYLEAGGYETEYGRFAEFALAATLHSTGKRIGYAPGAAVQHLYTTSFEELIPPVEDFVVGEVHYRADHPAAYTERYFGIPEEWAARSQLSRTGARRALGLAARALLRPAAWRAGTARPLLASAVRLAPTALLGPRPALAYADARFALTRLRCRLWRLSDRRLERAYRDALHWMARRARLRVIAELEPEAPEPVEETSFDLAEMEDQHLFGFHPAERVNGTSFRWSKAIASAELPVAPGPYRVEIETGGLRDPRALGVQVFFNGRRIRRSRLELAESRITFGLKPSDFASGVPQRLSFVAAPFRPADVAGSEETRELALPVSSLSFHRIDGDGLR